MCLIEKVGCRWVIAMMIFTSTCVVHMLRVNLSVNIVAMVPIASNYTNTSSEVILDWTPYQRAYVLSSYFWGYLVANLLAGRTSEVYGPRRVVFCSTLVGALLTLLSPLAAKHSYVAIVILRILLGFSAGFKFPAVYCLISSWAVPTERGKFVGAAIGGTIGTFITWSLCGVIVEAYGWEWGFYIFGIIALIWPFMWWALVFDSPEKHPRITSSEMQYITTGTKVTNVVKPIAPYRRMLLSVPVWSLLTINFGTGWGIYFVVTAAPNYLSNALGYKLSSTGLLAGLINLSRSFCSFAFGILGDYVLKRGFVSLRVLRNLACIVSHILPGCILMVLTLPGYSSTIYMVVIIMGNMLNGLVTQSSAANMYDLTRNFAGSLSGLTVAVVTAAGIISPLITAHFTKYNETSIEAWQPVFYTGAGLYIVTGLQFLLFSSTETQPWNEFDTNNQVKHSESN